MLYIFDEPTTGLHFDDVSKLLAAFRRLIEAGGSIVVIEHNLDVIKTADWVIDLGPEGGWRGGRVVAVGTPEDIVKVPESYTGQWLAPILARNGIAHPMSHNCAFTAHCCWSGHRVGRWPVHSPSSRSAPRSATIAWRKPRMRLRLKSNRPKPRMQKQDFDHRRDAAEEGRCEPIRRTIGRGSILGSSTTRRSERPEAIDAYRKSVAAKPDVFESNLNLGIVLARTRRQGRSSQISEGGNPTQANGECRRRPGARLAIAWTGGRVSGPATGAGGLRRRRRSSLPRIRAAPVCGAAAGAARKVRRGCSTNIRPRRHSIRRPRSRLPGWPTCIPSRRSLPEAEAQLRKLLELDPSNSDARTQLGRVLAAEGKQDEAAAALRLWRVETG